MPSSFSPFAPPAEIEDPVGIEFDPTLKRVDFETVIDNSTWQAIREANVASNKSLWSWIILGLVVTVVLGTQFMGVRSADLLEVIATFGTYAVILILIGLAPRIGGWGRKRRGEHLNLQHWFRGRVQGFVDEFQISVETETVRLFAFRTEERPLSVSPLAVEFQFGDSRTSKGDQTRLTIPREAFPNRKRLVLPSAIASPRDLSGELKHKIEDLAEREESNWIISFDDRLRASDKNFLWSSIHARLLIGGFAMILLVLGSLPPSRTRDFHGWLVDNLIALILLGAILAERFLPFLANRRVGPMVGYVTESSICLAAENTVIRYQGKALNQAEWTSRGLTIFGDNRKVLFLIPKRLMNESQCNQLAHSYAADRFERTDSVSMGSSQSNPSYSAPLDHWAGPWIE